MLPQNPRALRSPVPDLLFPEDRARRVHDLQGTAHGHEDLCVHPESLRPETPLHRITVFVSYRCNLRCGFCKTIVRSAEDLRILPQRAKAMDLGTFETMLETHRGTPIEHLHLTGGEASLHPELVAMIRAARAFGVRYISMTTNGTRPPEVYAELVRAGLDEIRISLDPSHEDGVRGGVTREGNTAPDGPKERGERTLAHLAKMRTLGTRFHLIVNSVVEPEGVDGLAARLETLLESGADDIKLITAVDERDRLSHHEQRGAVLSALHGRLDRWPSERFPLLRMKVHTVLSPAAIGLEQVASGRPYRCYIPLTERTVDATHYYPCSVYLREGGAPLGDLSDSAEQQRDRSVKFVTGHDCRKDPICARYCLHCTRLYNDDVNQAARGTRADEPPPAHYLVVSPLGLRNADALSEALRAEGVQVGRTWDLPAWADAADQLYRNETRPAPETLDQGGNPHRSAQYHRAWRERYPEDRGAIWEIPDPDQFRHLARTKRSLRLRFPNEWVGPGQTDAPDLHLHAFHVPELDDLPAAFQRTASYRRSPQRG